MSEKCKLCDAEAADWDGETLDEHLLANHTETEIRIMYEERHERLFSDGDPVIDDGPDEPEPSDDSFADESDGVDPFGDTQGRKWFVIGVGGAGNNIVDAILMRRDTLLRNDEDRAAIWQGGLAGYGILNTNIIELEETYYAQEEKGYDRNALLTNAIIGVGEHDYVGMGRRWIAGKEVMEKDFEDGPNPFVERWDMNEQHLQDAQAIMFVHSVTKGTGCGSTPVLADRIRTDVLNDDRQSVLSKALFSSVVIPSAEGKRSNFGGRSRTNGVVGLARISRAVDAIIPFDNERLDAAGTDVSPRIDGIERYNPPQYADLNKPLVAYLEAFTMSSTPQFVDQEATLSVRGEVFDVSDSYLPVVDKYPLDMAEERRPAVVLAPVLGRARGSTITASQLETLISNALFQNRLARFDPKTAWGATFLLYGPEEKMRDAATLVSDGVFDDIVGGEEFLDVTRTSGTESIDIYVDQLVIPYVDDVYLWGALWNPRMPSLERMYEHAAEIKDGNSRRAKNLQEVWEQVEPLFSCLGRENMG